MAAGTVPVLLVVVSVVEFIPLDFSLKLRVGLDTEIPEEVLVLVTTKLPLSVPLVKSLTSVSWGVVPLGAPAQIEAKFV
jgi:hypothetical protein